MPDASDAQQSSQEAARAPLFRSATGARLHLRLCPHLATVEEVLQAELDDPREVCVWSQNELNGVGRTYHDTVEAALADMGAAQHARAELARLLNEVEWDQVYVPHSRAYVAVSRANLPVAWAGKSYVDYPDRPTVLLLGYVPKDVDGGKVKEGLWGATCPDCNMQRSVNGVCGC